MIKAVISLTSWKKRIDTVHKTLESLGDNPEFPVVLVLSEDEFPDREVPSSLSTVHIKWVKENTKSFKKVLYTMLDYPGIPVISADDDAEYSPDFANALYEMHVKHPHSVITNFPNVKTGRIMLPNGFCTLYPPNVLDGALNALTEAIIATNNDDGYYGVWMAMDNVDFKYIMRKDIATFHDAGFGMGVNQLYKSGNSDIRVIVQELAKQHLLKHGNPIFNKKWIEYF